MQRKIEVWDAGTWDKVCVQAEKDIPGDSAALAESGYLRMAFQHLPVMADEVIRFLAPKPGGIYVDGTIGGAGHAARILETSAPNGTLIGFDRDAEALRAARERLLPFGGRVRLVQGNFAGVAEVLAGFGIGRIDGILLDLGVSSHQLDSARAGIQFPKGRAPRYADGQRVPGPLRQTW